MEYYIKVGWKYIKKTKKGSDLNKKLTALKPFARVYTAKGVKSALDQLRHLHPDANFRIVEKK